MYQLSPARERSLLWLLAATQFTLIMDFMVMMPLGPQIMQAFRIGPADFAAAVSAYSICAGLSGLFAATYIDRFDRRSLMLVVFSLFTLSNLACALAPNYAMLLASRAFAGLTGGVMGSIIMAIVGDVIPNERRGAATGVIMTAFSIAAVAGVPAGVVLGAHLGWAAAFYLLVLFSLIVLGAGVWLVPSLRAHLDQAPVPLSRVVPNLLALISKPAHMQAFALVFIMLVSQMMIIPFISPVLVANHGVQPQQISWIYMAGGAATFFTARRVGALTDRHGKQRVFRLVALLSIAPILMITHLPDLPFWGLLVFFPLFMVMVSSRMIPMQALMTTVPAAEQRGAFLSVNSAIMSLGSGCGA
ncbi:MFS transporter, partial [Chitinimonas sp.]|uniref:MFS transporter n=1 Tax=Chitinimonas sp. TaxID=1934313 RepID=UPI0035B0DE12